MELNIDMNILLRKKIYGLVLIIVTILILSFTIVFVYGLMFRITSYDKVVNSTDSYINIRFNKKITNFEQIYKEFSVSGDVYLVPSLLEDGMVLRLSSGTELNAGSEYTITIPSIYSGKKLINNLHLTFKVVGVSEGDNEFDGNKGAIYDNNLRKYSFMNNGEEAQKDTFVINVQDYTSPNPYFLLTLTPDIQDYSNQESKNQSYIQAFSDFEKYINSFGFKKEDLNIKVMPDYISDIVLSDYNKILEEEAGD